MKIANKEFDKKKIAKLVADVKVKPELNSLDDKFVKEHLIKVMERESRKTNQLAENFTHKSRQYREIVKLVRGDLRRVYGLFRDKKPLNDDLFNDFCKSPQDIRKARRVLESHSSTKERLNFYDKLYGKIFSITGKPKSLLDLGCGINPFSFPYMKLKNLTYNAYDISNKEIADIKKYFFNLKIDGTAEVFDILKFSKLSKLPQSDVALMFKMTDVVDRNKGHKGTEEVLLHTPANFIVVSFPTLTMSGKPMNVPRRKWIELLCNRLEFEFTVLEFSNEIFYVVNKT